MEKDSRIKEKRNKHSKKHILKIKFYFGQKSARAQILGKKIKIHRNYSILSEETNEGTIIRESLNYPNGNIQINILNVDNKISSKNCIPSINPSLLNEIEKNNLYSITTPNLGNSNKNSTKNYSIIPLYINLPPSKISLILEKEKEYYNDILKELLIEEEKNLFYKKCYYINYQKDLDNKRRAELIYFIYEISKIYNFKIRTIFLSVQIMDRFLSKEKIEPELYELLCICSLVISSKFNESYYPPFKHVLSFFAKEKNYTIKQAEILEIAILKAINYNLFPIFPIFFFDIIFQKYELSKIEYYLGCLMIELIQFDFCFYPFNNLIIAITVFCKVSNLTKGKDFNPFEPLKKIFPQMILNQENIDLISKLSNSINLLLNNINSVYFKDIYQKYSQPEILGNSINYFINK